VFSDPVNFIDPTGKFLFNVVSGAIGALIAGVNAADAPGATFGSILTASLIGGATGLIGLNPATFTLIKLGLVGLVNYGGNIAGQLNAGSKNLDHSQALMALLFSTSGVVGKGLDKITGGKENEILKYTKEFISQIISGEAVKFEGKQGRCKQ
jgi:hypothetical protein